MVGFTIVLLDHPFGQQDLCILNHMMAGFGLQQTKQQTEAIVNLHNKKYE